MVTPQLLDYIKQQLQQGISQEEIKKALLEVGWQETDIEEAFNTIGVTKVEIQPAIKPIKKSNLWSILLTIFITLITLAGIGFGVYWALQKFFK